MLDHLKLTDVIALWARERLEHDVLVARRIARGVIHEGLRVQSTGGQNSPADIASLCGYPYVGYSARPGDAPIVIRVQALEHLMAVFEERTDMQPRKLNEEFVARDALVQWLVHIGQPIPAFLKAETS